MTEEELNQKEEELNQREELLKEKEEEVFKNPKEKLYDKIQVPIKVLDGVIIASIIVVLCIFIFQSNF